MKPKVSVIMPVYNTKRFLNETILSILTQTFKEFEFIIVDDFSIDWSYELLQEYEKKDNRIKLYRNEKNMWISFTRNKLISLTNTNLIATQDSDDISESNRLELQYNFLINNSDYSAISSNNLIINESSEIIWKRIYEWNIDKIILKKSPLSNPSSMFKKDIFLKLWWYEDNLNYWEDYDLWLKMYLNWYKLKVLNNFLLRLRIRDWQTKSSKLKETLKNTINLQKKYIRLWIKPSFSDNIYIFLEQILLFLPNVIILNLFKILEYKKWKSEF